MKDIRLFTLGLSILYFCVGKVNSSHFGGGIFTWAPSRDGSNITVTFRITWTISHAACDDTTIANETLISSENITCFTGCTSATASPKLYKSSLAFKCTDFKTGQWSSGGNSLVLTTGVNQLSFGFSGGNWVILQEGGGDWYLKATVDLSVRSDIGRINTSPTADVPPVLYWQKDCAYSYSLAVHDVDDDVIRCRWAVQNGSNGDECADVCSAFSDLVLNESACVITNTASNTVGFYVVALQIEDFAAESSTTPLSSIPLQFLVYIYPGTGCPDPPQLISPTPAQDATYVIDKGDTLSLVIKARGPTIVVTMASVNRLSEVTSVESSWNYITLNATWTPSDSDVGQTRRICYYARDTVGVTSDTRCIAIVVTGHDNDNCNPEPCQNGGTCTDGLGDFSCACPPGYTGKNCSTVNTSHFGGGIFTWVPASDGSNITITFRITWEMSRVACDDTTVTSETPIGQESMRCFSGCSLTGTIGSLAYKCTDFKAGEWSSGGNSLVLTTVGLNQLSFGFSGGYWVDLQEGGLYWYLKATADLSMRSDTGRINTSPTADMPPVLYWQKDCTYSYTLTVNDVDNDVIRCRWASPNGTNGDECSGVCSAFSGLVVNEVGLEVITQITITFRIAWEIGRAPCDNATVANGTLIRSDNLDCFSGCTGTIGSLAFRCRDFKAGKWSSGGNSLVLKTGVNQLSFGFSGNAWVNLQDGGGYWYLKATVDLSVRSDTGRINSSPTADMPPVLYWQKDCTYSYTLAVNDVDGDVIRCRLATPNGTNDNECAGVCSVFSGLILNKLACTITNSASKNVGYYAVALQIEDFADESSTTPLSSIPLQFLVYIYSGTGCPDPPQLIEPTPAKDAQYVLDKGDTLSLVIKARGPNTVVTLATVTRVSEVTSVESSWNYIKLFATWTHSASDVGQKRRVCFYARDTVGVTSDTRCITIVVTGNDNNNCSPEPCQNGGTCTDGLGDFNCVCPPGYTGKTCLKEIDECLTNPCENGGTCTDRFNDYTCTCDPGFMDKNCSTNIDDCMVDTCENGGTCTDGINDYTCICVPGYTDKNCSTNIDECSTNPCDNGGTCSDEINNYTCTCVPGFSDKNCSTDIDECIGDPCDNGGTCSDGINDYTCTCVPGYTGKNCSNDIDECIVAPCDNGATCTDGINDYTCACVPGYTDKNCSTNIDECRYDSCENDGTCTDGINDYSCTCVPGYTDKNCSTDINECMDDPCENNGTCIDEINDYTCTCVPGYSGMDCTTNINECQSNPCQTGACIDKLNGYSCLCEPGFVGTYCDIDTDECISSPCKNGGTCSDGINGYKCSCAEGYTMANCQTEINECISSPCRNNANCSDDLNGYRCFCLEGYMGDNCETELDECVSNPCQFGGNCSDRINGYVCSCVTGYTGINCETDFDECLSNPCQFGGNCSDKISGYECSCLTGYTGYNCETGIQSLKKDKSNVTPIAVGAVLGAVVTVAAAVFVAYKIYQYKTYKIPKGHEAKKIKEEKMIEIKEENEFENKVFEHEIEMSEDEAVVNTQQN